LGLLLRRSKGSSQFSQGGEQRAVGGVLLQLVSHRLDDGHVVVKLPRPLPDQRGEAL
jgi:hypothetical protein